MNVTVYSCFTSGYEAVPPRAFNMGPYDRYVAYTDDASCIKTTWEIRKLASPASVKRGDLINRYHKFFAESLFPDADVSIYIDGNIDVVGDISFLVDEFVKSKALFGSLKHPQRKNVYEEIEAIRNLGKFKFDDAIKADKQLESYRLDGFPADFPLQAATVLFRRHGIDDRLGKAMSLWWRQVNTYTCRDQLSLPYVLWKTDLPYIAIDLDIFDNQIFYRRPHQSKLARYVRLKRRILGFVKKLNPESMKRIMVGGPKR